MEKFSSLLSPQYYYTDSVNEIPDFLYDNIKIALDIDWHNEIFVCSCWVDNFLSKGNIFLLVTNRRVVFKAASKLTQTLFQDTTSVETDLTGNIIISNTGEKYKIFGSSTLPSKELLSILFKKINNQWIKTKTNTSQPVFETYAANKPNTATENNSDTRVNESWWQKKTQTQKFFILGFSFICLWFLIDGVQFDKNNSEFVETETKAKKYLPDNLNAKNLKQKFNTSPFNYEYWQLSKFNDTNYTYLGYKKEYLTDLYADKVVIQFDPTTNEVYYVGLYQTTNKLNVKPKDVAPLVEFAGFFDERAIGYINSNFNNIFINENSYLDKSEFSFSNDLYFSITHDFITAKKLIQRDGDNSIKVPLNLSIEISNRNKKISLQ